MSVATILSVAVGGRELRLSNLQKLMWPAESITKAHLIEYYTRMAPYLLPYLRGRPLVLTRYPDGIDGKSFYHKDAPKGTPEWVRTWPFQAADGRVIRFLVADEPAVLTFAANLGAIELHPWLSRCETPDNPDWAVIDLDPSDGATFADILLLARTVRQLLAAVSVDGYPKLSGATGIHIYCPCHSDHTYHETAAFCEAVGRLLRRIYPEKVTLERAVAKRMGKVYVDYLQNRRGQTIATAYGLRPRTGAPVSAPVTWEEVESEPSRFNLETIGPRLQICGDLFAPILNRTQDLRRATLELSRML